jgi:hypothetical protein
VGFLESLESSGFGEWVRSSYVGYPMMIACHAVGMAIMVGLSVALALRVLGWFREIPYPALYRFLTIAWVGFAINFLSGSGLFAAQATTYVTDGTFLLKMAFVVAGMITVAIMQTQVKRYATSWGDGSASSGARAMAGISIFCWVAATITGRLIAYL